MGAQFLRRPRGCRRNVTTRDPAGLRTSNPAPKVITNPVSPSVQDRLRTESAVLNVAAECAMPRSSRTKGRAASVVANFGLLAQQVERPRIDCFRLADVPPSGRVGAGGILQMFERTTLPSRMRTRCISVGILTQHVKTPDVSNAHSAAL
jgi:hypothetical protein